MPKNTRDKEDISRKEHTDEKNEKRVTFNDNAEKENVRGKQEASERKQANSDVGQKKPLNDKTNKDVSRTNNANDETPQGKQKVSKDEKANEDISQKHPPDKTTKRKQKETLSDKTNKGITRVDNADKDTPKEKQKVPKDKKLNVAISQKDPLEKPTKKDSTDNNNADKAPPKAKQKASKDEEANQSISPKDPPNEKTNTPTPRSVTSEEERAWEKLIPNHNHLSGKAPQPKDQFFGLIRLENISATMHNKEYARGNLFGDDIMEAPDYNAPHTAFQVCDTHSHFPPISSNTKIQYQLNPPLE